MKTTIRSLLQMFAFATVALTAISQASAQDIQFKATSIYNNAEPNNPNGRIIVYNLPSTGVYAGPVNTFFDVANIVAGGSPLQVAGYGVIMETSMGAGGSGGMIFTTPDPAPAGTNNMQGVVFGAQNAGLSVILGETNVDPNPLDNRSLGVVGLHPTANANTSLANNDGLFRVPFRVNAGVVDTFTLGVGLRGNTYSGFAQSNGTLMTSAAATGATNFVEVRQSKRGDMNGDLALDGEDIAPFIAALSNFNSYKASRPWLQADYITDLFVDHAIDGQDIQPFIAILSGTGSSPSAVPEPSTIVLLGMGGLGLLAVRRYRRK